MERLLLRPARRLPYSRLGLPGRPSWTCASCRTYASLGRSGHAPSSETSSPDTKPYYVTTPIFYVNAAPHVGHLYSMVLADAIKRWHALNGRKALLLTGTDEHGIKVQRAAIANETSPQVWCDTHAQKFRELAEKANISNDFFIRTTDQDHKDAVRHFWFLLRERGYIYEAKYEGWYCVSDETFYTESQLTKKQDWVTGRVYDASIETGNEVEWMEERTYQFRMTALKDQLLEFYRQNPEWITPAFRMQEVVNWVTNQLEDLSISRPRTRLEWGIQVPDDEGHTIYVWVDALVNYLTKAGFPNWAPGTEREGGWPADMHVIGKDILRFHGVYWPALLLAVGIPPPKRILSHGHWTMNGQKMSKSLGNVVNPYHAIDRWGVDTMRYFMLLDGGIKDDANYDNAIIQARYLKDLKNSIGNLLSRITRTKLWSVRESVQVGCTVLKDFRRNQKASNRSWVRQSRMKIAGLYQTMGAEMEEGRARNALAALKTYVGEANASMQQFAPWSLAKQIHVMTSQQSGDATQLQEELCHMIFLMAEMLRHVGILLQPFMPGKAEHLLDVLGVSKERRSFEYVGLGRDSTYGVPLRDPGSSSHDGLFPMLEVAD